LGEDKKSSPIFLFLLNLFFLIFGSNVFQKTVEEPFGKSNAFSNKKPPLNHKWVKVVVFYLYNWNWFLPFSFAMYNALSAFEIVS
jgi:hypothetical protein